LSAFVRRTNSFGDEDPPVREERHELLIREDLDVHRERACLGELEVLQGSGSRSGGTAVARPHRQRTHTLPRAGLAPIVTWS
jgi:hypothetical protein